MKKRYILKSFLLFIFFQVTLYADGGMALDQQKADSPTITSLCERLIDYKKTERFELLKSPEAARRFYSEYCSAVKSYAWFDSSMNPTPQAFDLLRFIDSAYGHGLNPDKYHKTLLKHYLFTILKKPFATAETKMQFVDHADMFFSDAYLTLAHDLHEGFTDWETFQTLDINDETIEWDRTEKKETDFGQILQKALRTNDVFNSLKSLEPDYNEYGRLMTALATYRHLAKFGKFKPIPDGETIRKGTSDERLPLVQERLLFLGDMNQSNETPSTTFYNDPDLIRAVESFQIRHNLTPDGVIGKNTINALNVPISQRITQLILSMERYRWLKRGMDNTQAYISINIPSYRLQLLEKGDELFSMKVIVGKKERPTPVLNSKIAYAVLNPTWTAPETIIREDILGKKDVIKYLKSHDMRVFQVIDNTYVELNPSTIDWKHYKAAGKTPFLFRADAGDDNPLGDIKFIFPNRYSVYMHDTNLPELFDKEYRALSSGCIRLSDPSQLLTYLSPKQDIISTRQKDNHKIELGQKLPIVIRYMTAASDQEGRVYFYEDAYGYDKLHLQIINPIDLPMESKAVY